MSALVRGEFASYRVSSDVLNKGRGGAIHRTDDPGLVYKEYVDAAKAPRRADLDRLVTVGRSVLLDQGKKPGDTPESSVNWPVDIVLTPGGGVKGVILPIIPAALLDPALDCVRTLDFLVMKRAKPPAAQARVALLIRMAEILDFVQSRGLVHGDVNGKNLAWSVDPDVIMYLIDCDGMVPQSPPPAVGVQAMGWTDPRVIDRVIPAHDHLSDRYALALAMYRGLLLTPGKLDQKNNGRWPEPGKIPADMPSSVAALLRRGLAALDGEGRPTPREWVTALVDTYVPNGAFASHELDALDRASGWTPTTTTQFTPLPGAPSQPRPTPPQANPPVQPPFPQPPPAYAPSPPSFRNPPAPRVDNEDVQFTVYRPRTVRPARWHPLLAYVHRATPFIDEDGKEVDPVSEIQRRAEQALGPRAPLYGPVITDIAASLPRGNELVLEPWIVEGEFNPARSAIRWEEPIHEVPFRLRVPAQADGRRLDAGMRVYLGVLLIAELRFSVRVDSAASSVAESNEPVRAAPYRRIFASYSHRDTEVVARLRAAAAAFGDSYLIDLDDLRAGEAWEPRLAELITEADVFQLFWSRHSMRSPFVRQEWEHALSLNRAHFVRPVYWEDPRPEDPVEGLPPTALDRLQFCRLQPIAVGSSPAPAGPYPWYEYRSAPRSTPTPPWRSPMPTSASKSRRSSRPVAVLIFVVVLLVALVVVIAVLR